MKKNKLGVVFVLLLLLLSAFLSGLIVYETGSLVFDVSMQVSTNEDDSLESKIPYLKKHGLIVSEFKQQYSFYKVQIKSSLDGHMIPGDLISTDGNKKRDTVIMVHGLNGNRYSLYTHARIFLDMGYNVLVYDQRSSGENTAPYNTYGVWEQYDLSDAVQYMHHLTNGKRKIGIWGTSMGGATACIYLGREEANLLIDFVVLDCPLSSMRYKIQEGLKEVSFDISNDYMLMAGSAVTQMRLGFEYKDAEVCQYLTDTAVPVLVLNSKADIVTPYFMGKDIYEAVPHHKKKLFTVSDSRHTQVVYDYPKECTQVITAFIRQFAGK